MALANFTLASVAAASPALADTSPVPGPLRLGLDDLLYSPEDHQLDSGPRPPGNEPFASPVSQQQRRSKIRKRAGTAYLPPPNQFTHYPRHEEVPQNPYGGQLHTQIYQQNTRLDIQIENQRVHELNPQYDNTGQYVHDPTGDYDYEQRRINQKNGQRPLYSPGYSDAPYPPATTPSPASSRRFEAPSNQNVNNFNFVNGPVSTPAPLPPRQHNSAGTKGGSGSSGGQTPSDRPPGFTKVETGGSGGKTQLHAVIDYDDDYYDDNGSDSGQPAVTPVQGPILLRNGSVPVVPLTSYQTVNNGSFYQIPILWTALSVALGYELQGQIVRGVPCVKRNFQLYCPTAGNTYPLDKIEEFIDENKALIKRMYGSFATPGGSRVRRAPGVPDMHAGDSYFRHVRQASNTQLPDPQSVNNTGRAYGSGRSRPPGVPDMHAGDSYFRQVRQASQSVNNTGRVDSCQSKTEIMTPYWALNSARKLRAIVNTMHFEQAIHQEVCSKKSTGRCSGDCGCEQKYKWHRLLAYDPNDDCAGIFMDWFLFPSCCVCRCNP